MTRSDLRRLLGNPPLVIGLAMITLLVVIGGFGAALAPRDPNAATNLIFRSLPDGSRTFQVPPTMPDGEHWLGTDALGRDQLSRILAGAWLTLAVVVSATVVRFLLGVSIGIASGWFGGPVARAVRVVGRGVTALPQLLLAILLVLVTRPLGVVGFIAALALVGWPEVAEYVGAEARRARSRPFVEAARSIGASDTRLVRTHLLAALGPQLLTLGALETGSVLLLLAELGIVGLFVSGATFFVAQGLVGGEYRTTPLMGRTPEWGQMLGAIQFYAIQEQLATLLPALFIVLAASSFALLADGLRAASDPYGTRTLRPATFSALSKVLAGALCFSAVGFIGLNVSAPPLTMAEGRDAATQIAHKTWPGSILVAAVARYVSPRSFERPDRLTYYFRNAGGEILRVSFAGAARLSADVRPYSSEDDLPYTELRPLTGDLASYAGRGAYANEHGGGELRAGARASVYRVIATWPRDRASPVYTVTIGMPTQLTIWRFCCFDAPSGRVEPDSGWRNALPRIGL